MCYRQIDFGVNLYKLFNPPNNQSNQKGFGVKLCQTLFIHGHHWFPRRSVKPRPACCPLSRASILCSSWLNYLLVQTLGGAHLECYHQSGKTTDNTQDAEDERQGKRGDEGTGDQEQTKQNAQYAQDSRTPSCTLECLDQTDDTDHDPEKAEHPHEYCRN